MKTHGQFIEIFERIDFEKIIDHPNILIAARFWDNERYGAAATCYRFMRMIDDLIDNHKAEFAAISESEKGQFTEDVRRWLGMIRDKSDMSPFGPDLVSVIDRFRIPLWALEDFAVSMLYDINHDGFATVGDFITYSKGASVAPASIFVHLAGLQGNGQAYDEPPYDVRETALPCAMFSYFVHIMRDFCKDQMNNLSYFADDVMAKNGLTREDMRVIAETGKPVPGFRNLMHEYRSLADRYRLDTLRVMEKVCPVLEPRYRLSLEIIFELYLMVFERIDPDRGTFTTAELNPTPAETRDRVLKVINSNRYLM